MCSAFHPHLSEKSLSEAEQRIFIVVCQGFFWLMFSLFCLFGLILFVCFYKKNSWLVGCQGTKETVKLILNIPLQVSRENPVEDMLILVILAAYHYLLRTHQHTDKKNCVTNSHCSIYILSSLYECVYI